jgi:hypothetical protein
MADGIPEPLLELMRSLTLQASPAAQIPATGSPSSSVQIWGRRMALFPMR